MKKLLLFAGLPGVGKSTISVKMSKKTGAQIVDIDDFKKTEVDPVLVKSQVDPPELRWSYYQKALWHAFHLFDQGTSIVMMDEVFHLNSLRDRLQTLCEEKGVRVLWIEVKCPYCVVEARLRSTARKGHILSAEEALKMNRLFHETFEDFPAKYKNHIVVNNKKSDEVDLMLENILQALA